MRNHHRRHDRNRGRGSTDEQLPSRRGIVTGRELAWSCYPSSVPRNLLASLLLMPIAARCCYPLPPAKAGGHVAVVALGKADVIHERYLVNSFPQKAATG